MITGSGGHARFIVGIRDRGQTFFNFTLDNLRHFGR